MKTRSLTLIMLIGITTLMLYGCSFFRGTGSASNDTSICSNYSKADESQLEVGLINTMTSNYQKMPNDGVEAIWFDLETLKKFVYHIEMNAKTQDKAITSQDLGVRIYYSRYPKKSDWGAFNRDLSGLSSNPLTNQYELKHTLIMIPTKKIGSINHDFNPLDVTTFTSGLTPAYNFSSSSDSSYNPTQLMFALTPTTSAQNHGQLHPPYSDTGMEFSW